jgi:hypothetical protein
MRPLLAFLLLGHGVAHTVGFVVPWKLLTSPDVPYRTTVMRGAIDLGSTGIRLLGLIWLVVALLFVGLAAAVFEQRAWWHETAFVLIGVSVVLCVLGLPESRPGLLANVVILVLVIAGTAWKWFPEVIG